MKRKLIIFLVGGFLTAGLVGELSAQTDLLTDSAARRSSLFGASRISLFNAGGDRGADRDILKVRSLETDDQMMLMLGLNDPSEMLGNPNVSNRNLFMTSTLQQALMGADAETDAEEEGGLIATDSTNLDVNSGVGMSTIRGPGIYAPRLRFLPAPEELSAQQTPEAIAMREEAEHELTKNLLEEITDKFDLPTSGNISLLWHGSMVHLQGRVPSPLQRKQVELYLGLEPDVHFVQNDLIVDPSLVADIPTVDVTVPTMHGDLVEP